MPLLWLSIMFLAGILLGDFLQLPELLWLAPGGAALGLLLVPRLRLRPHFSPLPVPILIAALCLGGLRASLSRPEITPEHVAYWVGQPVVLEGVVAAPPDLREAYSGLEVRAVRLHPAGELPYRSVTGRVLARLPVGDAWHYGDRVRLQGRLEAPPGDENFDYAGLLARRGIYAYLPEASGLRVGQGEGSLLLLGLDRLRNRALEVVYRQFPDPEASLLAGILLGVERGIPERVQQAFQATGTSHVIAISGFNFAVIAAALASFSGRLFGKRRGALFAALGIAGYALLVGANPAVVRAAILSGLSLLAGLLGRRQHGLNSLAFVAAIMALHDPNVLWDTGFQLSFAATLGLLLYAAPLQEAFTNTARRLARGRLTDVQIQRLSGLASDYLLLTLAAQLTTLPVLLYHFQRLSLSALLANPLILPAQPAVLLVGGPAVILGLLVPPLGQALAYLTWPFLAYTIRVVELFARLPGGDFVLGSIPLWIVALFYTFLLGWTLGREQIKALLLKIHVPATVLQPSAWRPGLVLSVIALIAVLVWQAVLSAPDGRLHLTVLDVGPGEALLVQAPGGQRLLINGGQSSSRLSDGLGRRLPLLRRELDFLVVASIEDEDLEALPATIERFPPKKILWAGAPAGTRAARTLQRAIAAEGIPLIQAEAGQVLELGGGARLEILSAGKRGAVLQLVYGSFRALLPLGVDSQSLESLSPEPVSALLLAEGGYAPVNPPEWLHALQPQVVLLSVQPADYRGRPDPETLQALEGYSLLRTDQNGWIELETDGVRLWVEVEKR